MNANDPAELAVDRAALPWLEAVHARRRVLQAVAAGLVLALLPALARAASTPALPKSFDPKRDPVADLAAATQLAASSGRRVIMDVGGEWCSWCHILDRFFASHPDLLALREQHYVWLKVNYSPDNRNEAFLGQWPKIKGYPHLFVVDPNGKLVHSQDTAALERGESYSADALRAFLVRYAPPSGGAGRA